MAIAYFRLLEQHTVLYVIKINLIYNFKSLLFLIGILLAAAQNIFKSAKNQELLSKKVG